MRFGSAEVLRWNAAVPFWRDPDTYVDISDRTISVCKTCLDSVAEPGCSASVSGGAVERTYLISPFEQLLRAQVQSHDVVGPGRVVKPV